MEKEYVVRKIDPSTPRRVSPPRRPPKKRRRGNLPIGPLAAAAAVVVLVIVLVVIFTRGKGEGQEDEASSAVSQASSLPELDPPSTWDTASLPETEPEPTIPEPSAPDGEPDTFDSMIVAGGRGYGLYKFSEEDTNDFIRLVCEVEQYLPESASLYSMIVPTALDVLLPESYIEEYEIDSSDQRKAIEDYIYPSMQNLNGEVHTVSLFDALRMHCDEDIYFRSDPTWTQRGAYYAYVQFCEAAGLEAADLDSFTLNTYEGYLGSYYYISDDGEMGANPDSVEAFVSPADEEMYYVDRDGNEQSGCSVIQDGDGYNPEWLNLIFMAGDQPYAEITNNDLDDGSACIVVKDTLGNVFAPFLAEHYQTVYVVDYRYYNGNVPNLAEQVGATEVILLTSLSITSSSDAISSLSSIF